MASWEGVVTQTTRTHSTAFGAATVEVTVKVRGMEVSVDLPAHQARAYTVGRKVRVTLEPR